VRCLGYGVEVNRAEKGKHRGGRHFGGGGEPTQIKLLWSRSENGGARRCGSCGYGHAWAGTEEGTTLNPVMNKTGGARCGTTSKSRGGGRGKRRRWGSAFYQMRRGGGMACAGRPRGSNTQGGREAAVVACESFQQRGGRGRLGAVCEMKCDTTGAESLNPLGTETDE
jgi:hypothetical protein